MEKGPWTAGLMDWTRYVFKTSQEPYTIHTFMYRLNSIPNVLNKSKEQYGEINHKLGMIPS
jgi:hypothetical protein